MSKNVLVLGSSGMLGSMVTKVLAKSPEITVVTASRTHPTCETLINLDIRWHFLDIELFDPEHFVNVLKIQNIQYIINCIGVTKPFIDEKSTKSRDNAILINSIFPSMLANTAEDFGIQVLQIATDCVYSGISTEFYTESSPHDATDIYGKTKSLGEVPHPNIHHLRCSIIGPEPTKNAFLLEWFLNQPQNSTISGFQNHLWNGITTYHFARICQGIIENDIELPNMQHIVPSNSDIGEGWHPADVADKFRLLNMFAKHYNRPDITINRVKAEKDVNRAINTENKELNQKIWEAAKYTGPPSIDFMIEELSKL